METITMSETLPASPVTDSDSVLRSQERARKLRARYLEHLGENTTIELRRITPEVGPIWDQIGQLRKEVYVDEHSYLEPGVLDENGREYDEYDYMDDTVHICALDAENNVVGYVRILTKDEDILPAEKIFDLRLDENTVEISRLISRKSFASPRITLALIRAVMHELNSNPEKYHATVATLENFLSEHLRNMGVPVAPLNDIQATPEYNSSNMLVAIDHAGIIDNATIMDRSGIRKPSVLYPEQLGPWFAEMKTERGLGRVALVEGLGE